MDTPPPLNGAAIVMPLIAMRPSLIGPPRAAKKVIVGDAASAPSLTFRPGTAFSRVPTERFPGMAATTSALSTVSRCALWTSTTGVSPVTVIVSSSAPTRMSIGIVSVVGAAELDALPPDDVEAGQPERQRVRAGIQTGNAVLPRAVGDGRAHLFDEGRAGGFDGHARQHGRRLVPDGAGKSALRKRKGRQQDSRRQNQDGLRRSAHCGPPSAPSAFHRG